MSTAPQTEKVLNRTHLRCGSGFKLRRWPQSLHLYRLALLCHLLPLRAVTSARLAGAAQERPPAEAPVADATGGSAVAAFGGDGGCEERGGGSSGGGEARGEYAGSYPLADAFLIGEPPGA